MAADGSLPPDKKALQVKLMNTRLELEKKIRQKKAELSELEDKLTENSNAKIEALKSCYPGVRLVFDDVKMEVTDEYSRVMFRMRDGEIKSQPL